MKCNIIIDAEVRSGNATRHGGVRSSRLLTKAGSSRLDRHHLPVEVKTLRRSLDEFDEGGGGGGEGDDRDGDGDGDGDDAAAAAALALPASPRSPRARKGLEDARALDGALNPPPIPSS
jgi:hypothetical protein